MQATDVVHAARIAYLASWLGSTRFDSYKKQPFRGQIPASVCILYPVQYSTIITVRTYPDKRTYST